MENLYNQAVLNANNLFDGHYLDGKYLYLQLFNRLPDITGMVNIDGEKAFGAVKEKFAGRIKKRVLFLSTSAAQNLMNPGFVEILISNPNTVLIIEDAENIIMDRRFSSGSSVSNLLNISDGLLADCLNVQLICTFNSPLTTVDNALLRKGRLIARYDFGKLNITRAQRLSDHLGFGTTIVHPMTVAEIANQNEKEYEVVETRTIGFRN